MTITKKIAVAAGLAVLGSGAYLGFGASVPENVAHAKQAEWTAESKVDLSNDAAKLGYTFGAQIAFDMKRQNLDQDIELEAMFAAFKDAFAGQEPRMSVEDMQAAQVSYQQKQQAKFDAIGETNLAAGKAFLVENAKSKEVVTTASGLQYQVLREGKGSQPKATDTVKVHYLGKLIDDKKFDSSYDRGTPADFGVSGVIPGFSEGLQLMKEGAKYRFVIPSEIAYGPQGPGSIGPNQVLIFEVELIEVVTQSTTKKES